MRLVEQSRCRIGDHMVYPRVGFVTFGRLMPRILPPAIVSTPSQGIQSILDIRDVWDAGRDGFLSSYGQLVLEVPREAIVLHESSHGEARAVEGNQGAVGRHRLTGILGCGSSQVAEQTLTLRFVRVCLGLGRDGWRCWGVGSYRRLRRARRKPTTTCAMKAGRIGSSARVVDDGDL